MEDSETNNMDTNLSEYEQKRLINLKRNYEFLESSGFPTFKTPKFAVPKKKKIFDQRRNGKENDLLKNVTFKLFGVDKNSTVTKENVPLDSELQKFVPLIQDSSRKKVGKRGTEKAKLKTVLDVTYLKNLIKSSEDFHDGLGKQLIQEKSNEIENGNLEMEREYDAMCEPRRYPRRNLQRKCYKEEEVSSDDEFLYCDSCDFQYKGTCPHHPMIWVCDRKTSKNDPDKAKNTMPNFLSISNSAIPKAGLGVWTEIALPQGFVFGPYKGKIVRKKQEVQKSGYAWQVWKGQKALHFVEGKDMSDSNWLRFVNCANHEGEQNVMAIQYKKQVFYKTYKPLLPYTEILVWYGGEYANDMGIDTTEDKIITPSADIDGFRCEVCERLFASSSALDRHQKNHPYMQPDRRHRCAHCPYSSDHHGHLRYHLLTHSGERPHRCEDCGKSFTRKFSLEKHLLIHSGELPFPCGTCGKRFNRRSILITHERTHTGEKPHRCITCGKDFNCLSDLVRHELTHTKQKPYRCPHCQYRSSWATGLREHIKGVHTKERNHSCPHCQYKSSRASELNQHITVVHTKDFKHVCSFCSKGFTRPSRLQSHFLKEHLTETK